jgi:hypothetical protein
MVALPNLITTASESSHHCLGLTILSQRGVPSRMLPSLAKFSNMELLRAKGFHPYASLQAEAILEEYSFGI